MPRFLARAYPRVTTSERQADLHPHMCVSEGRAEDHTALEIEAQA